METSSINLQLQLGAEVPAPAPKDITEKLQSVQVTHSDSGPAGFQLSFNADRTKGLSQDFALLSSPLLKPSVRVLLTISISGVRTTLMDGFITRQELVHSTQFGASTLTITGEDVSVVMDVVEVSDEFPQMGAGEIAELVLAKYSTIGIVPEIIPTPTDLIPSLTQRVPQQNGTDRCYVNELAGLFGYVFYVQPGTSPLTNVAYFGPPQRESAPKSALTVGSGSATNVESISFKFDSIAPTLVDGFVQGDETEEEEDVPLTTVESTRQPPLAAEPALDAFSLFQRRKLFTDPRFGIAQALVDGQATTDVSTDKVVVGEGKLNTVRYGDVLTAPGIVPVRGVGQSYDGLYYVQSVTHNISRTDYKQSFTLTREGVGSTITNVNL